MADMSNHYDPSEDRIGEEQRKATEMRAAVSSKSPSRIQSDVRVVLNELRAAEDHVLGGKAIDRLRLAQSLIRDLFTEGR